MALNLILLYSLVLAAVWTVMTIRLIRAVVGLALTSAILAMIMYRLHAPLAAVFELSVCSGLISVIFITTVSFTQRVSKERWLMRRRERLAKFWLLPVILVAAGFLLMRYLRIPEFVLALPADSTDVRGIIWNLRHLDLFGQVLVLLAGVFGVVILFKESET